MAKIIFLMGLPGSGKSTWAKQYLAEHPRAVRVCKDDLRAMLHDGKHCRDHERFIITMRDVIVDEALFQAHEVIVDDTNLHPKHRAALEEIAAKHNALFEVKDFTDVPLELCIERDLRRQSSVGERVIRQMHRQFLAPKIPKTEPEPTLPNAIICDLDGTLALFGDANPYDRDFSKDQVNKAVLDVLYRYEMSADIIFFSGRKEKHRSQTAAWLVANKVPTMGYLYMRRDDDNRRDVEVKEELYNQQIRGKYNVRMVIDDRLQVCRMWHRLGLPLFRIGDPDADF